MVLKWQMKLQMYLVATVAILQFANRRNFYFIIEDIRTFIKKYEKSVL